MFISGSPAIRDAVLFSYAPLEGRGPICWLAVSLRGPETRAVQTFPRHFFCNFGLQLHLDKLGTLGQIAFFARKVSPP